MKRLSTILILLSAVLFIGVYFFPLWSISLAAPQYPEGMGMKIWIHKVTGEGPHDLQNINGLNHYIGMREIHADSIPELKFMKFIAAGLIAFAALVGLIRRRALLVAWVVVAMFFAVVGLVDFWKWEYDYGHNLDPDAPIKVPGMTYQPPLIGSKVMLNITATSLPALGGLMAMLSVALGVVAVFNEYWLSRRRAAKKVAGTTAQIAAVICIFGIGMSACSPGPAPIEFGKDGCNFCKMTISDEKYGAELVTKKGRVYKYDSIECLVNEMSRGTIDSGDVHLLLTVDYSTPKALISATTAVYLHSPTLRSPMGMNLTAFATAGAADETRARHKGELLAWPDVATLVLNAGKQ